MPVDMKRYPKDWKTRIVPMIRKRSKGRCECTGECGKSDGHSKKSKRCLARNYKPHPTTGSKVILTVAHMGKDTGDKHNKMDVRPGNLKDMCQRCHLNYDRDEHKENANKTRRKRFIESGNVLLPTFQE